MNYNVWLPVMLSLSLYIPSILLVLCLPETSKFGHLPTELMPDIEASNNRAGVGDEQREMGQKQSPLWNRLYEGIDKLRKASLLLIRSNWSITLLLLTIFIARLSAMAQSMLLQFARRKFGWPWSKVCKPSKKESELPFALF